MDLGFELLEAGIGLEGCQGSAFLIAADCAVECFDVWPQGLAGFDGGLGD